MSLQDELNRIALENGVQYFGVANLSEATDFIVDQGGGDLSEYPYAISIGIRLMDPIVDKLSHRNERSALLNYKHHAYDVINSRLDMVTSILSSHIQDNGYAALPLPSSKRIDDERICAQFSHKLAAHLSGFGWIGKSCLLITPDNGPRVRWATILTDAPLQPTGSSMESRCGSCSECVKICPVQAFTGRNFVEGESREMRYNARKCENYFKEMENNEQLAVCGLCVYVCPHGRKKN
ncbi:4Fe-4S double cluster binding domain-containing protein [Methanolobus sediminis]|uniref:4Fe-4S double cluster binding domain-containing protein n=1 Tax=Methanolobus sediminis TaxID=3072978 RepID=A0AA51UI17_9EURY|nr:4Fe-4S double cluster binding domain-containing protein [Methanolobus sediminis]WMW23820.1 4Fe-4S double cluster binding domain-containing protein [Methanolobus sediminis]